MNDNWFSIHSEGESAEVRIYDEIGGYGVSASDFRNEIEALSGVKNITLRINSPGGSVFEGIPIHNALLSHPAEVTVIIDGWAASMASIIAMAGDTVIMPENTWLMIHNAWTGAVGNANDLRRTVELLDGIDANAAHAYHRKATDLEESDIRAYMDNETWFNAEDAVSLGFADKMVDPVEAYACVDASAFSAIPEEAKVWAKFDDVELILEEDDAGDESDANDEDDEEDDVGDATPIEVAYDEGLAAGEEAGKAQAIAEFDGIREPLVEKIASQGDEIEDLTAKVASLNSQLLRLTPGLEAPEDESLQADTWNEAVEECGDYVEARKKYPALYRAKRAQDKLDRS